MNFPNPPILSERSMTEHRKAIEHEFARVLGGELIVGVKGVDLNRVRKILKNSIAKNIWGLWLAGIELGKTDANRELKMVRWQPPTARFAMRGLENLPARQAILDRVNLLSGNVADTEFDRIKDALQDNIKGELSRSGLIRAIADVLGGDRFTARARAIARTELTAAYNTGRVQSYRDAEIQAVRYYCIRDERTCQRCGSLNGMTVRLDSPDLVRMFPPLHTNCRCTLSPVVDMQQLIDSGRKLRNREPAWEMEGILNARNS